MKIDIQYLNDIHGTTQAVQLPISDWEKVLQKIKKYEQVFKFRNEIKKAFEEAKEMKKSKGKKQTLNDFLNEL